MMGIEGAGGTSQIAGVRAVVESSGCVGERSCGGIGSGELIDGSCGNCCHC